MLTAWLGGKLISMQKKPHLSPWWSSRTKTGHNPAPRGATVGLIHLTFTSIQMRPTATALGDAVIKSDFLKYSTVCIVAGAVKQDETGWKGERAILSLHWPCLNARCEMRSSGLTPSFLPRPGIIIIKKGKKMQPKAAAVTTMFHYPVCLLYKCTTGT